MSKTKKSKRVYFFKVNDWIFGVFVFYIFALFQTEVQPRTDYSYVITVNRDPFYQPKFSPFSEIHFQRLRRFCSRVGKISTFLFRRRKSSDPCPTKTAFYSKTSKSFSELFLKGLCAPIFFGGHKGAFCEKPLAGTQLSSKYTKSYFYTFVWFLCSFALLHLCLVSLQLCILDLTTLESCLLPRSEKWCRQRSSTCYL